MQVRPRKVVAASFSQRTTSSESDAGEYVFDIDKLADGSRSICSLSNNSIVIHDVNSLALVSTVNDAHKSTINMIQSSSVDSSIFYSAADDCTVCQWDARVSNRPCFRLADLGAEVSSIAVGMNDNLLAVGCESSIRFYDIRGGSGGTLLGTYADMHTDIVTHLAFHPQKTSLLTSGAEDGLICVFDTSVSAQQDAVVSICNTETAVRRFGYFGEGNEGIYVISSIEGLSIWHYPSAQRIADMQSIREQMRLEYLVDCIYEQTSNSLVLVGGNYDGSAYLVEVDPSGNNQLRATLFGGHKASVRCCTSVYGSILTGGEDSRICCWDIQAPSLPVSHTNNQASAVGVSNISGPITAPFVSHQLPSSGAKRIKYTKVTNHLRHKPY